ncbi:hypothetical protein VPH184E373B_0037 [Vibrio phage 184E37-3b]
MVCNLSEGVTLYDIIYCKVTLKFLEIYYE